MNKENVSNKTMTSKKRTGSVPLGDRPWKAWKPKKRKIELGDHSSRVFFFNYFNQHKPNEWKKENEPKPTHHERNVKEMKSYFTPQDTNNESPVIKNESTIHHSIIVENNDMIHDNNPMDHKNDIHHSTTPITSMIPIHPCEEKDSIHIMDIEKDQHDMNPNHVLNNPDITPPQEIENNPSIIVEDNVVHGKNVIMNHDSVVNQDMIIHQDVIIHQESVNEKDTLENKDTIDNQNVVNNMEQSHSKSMVSLAFIGYGGFSNYPLVCEKIDAIRKDMIIEHIVSSEGDISHYLVERYANEHGLSFSALKIDFKKCTRDTFHLKDLDIINVCNQIIVFCNGPLNSILNNSIQNALEEKKRVTIVNEEDIIVGKILEEIGYVEDQENPLLEEVLFEYRGYSIGGKHVHGEYVMVHIMTDEKLYSKSVEMYGFNTKLTKKDVIALGRGDIDFCIQQSYYK